MKMATIPVYIVVNLQVTPVLVKLKLYCPGPDPGYTFAQSLGDLSQ
jgi:hypothetical protein